MKNKIVRFYTELNRGDGTKQKIIVKGVVMGKIKRNNNTLYIVSSDDIVNGVSVFILDPLDIEKIET